MSGHHHEIALQSRATGRAEVAAINVAGIFKMAGQLLNVKFVWEVEKHPCLYNYKLKKYSKKDITENAR